MTRPNDDQSTTVPSPHSSTEASDPVPGQLVVSVFKVGMLPGVHTLTSHGDWTLDPKGDMSKEIEFWEGAGVRLATVGYVYALLVGEQTPLRSHFHAHTPSLRETSLTSIKPPIGTEVSYEVLASLIAHMEDFDAVNLQMIGAAPMAAEIGMCLLEDAGIVIERRQAAMYVLPRLFQEHGPNGALVHLAQTGRKYGVGLRAGANFEAHAAIGKLIDAGVHEVDARMIVANLVEHDH